MLLSVCIVNWNTCEYLRQCLAALYAYPPRSADMEVIVVDNASADGSAQMVATQFPQALLIASAKNNGYAVGNNLALMASQGDYTLLLNPDVIVGENSLSHALQFMQAHPDTGALGCRLVSADGSTQRTVRGFPDPWPVMFEYLGLARLFPQSRRFGAYRMTYFDYSQNGEVDQPMGSFLVISRSCLDQVGLMDAQFPIFFNEVDWCWRAKREHGWKIYYTADAVAVHYGGGSTRQVKARMVTESHRSLLRFYHKHYQGQIAPWLYALITWAVLWNERRLLRTAQG